MAFALLIRRRLDHIKLPAGETVDIKPGRPTHLMMMNVREVIELGQQEDVTKLFESGGKPTATFEGVTGSRAAWEARTGR